MAELRGDRAAAHEVEFLYLVKPQVYPEPVGQVHFDRNRDAVRQPAMFQEALVTVDAFRESGGGDCYLIDNVGVFAIGTLDADIYQVGGKGKLVRFYYLTHSVITPFSINLATRASSSPGMSLLGFAIGLGSRAMKWSYALLLISIAPSTGKS